MNVPTWAWVVGLAVVAYIVWRKMGAPTAGNTKPPIPLGAYWPGIRR
jgi:hypothetical protein